MKVVIEMLTRRVDYPRFRQIYTSDAFYRELVSAINLSEYTVRDRTLLPDGKERLRVYVAPRVELPSAIAKLIAGRVIGYEETTIYDPVRRRAEVAIQTAGGDFLAVSAVTSFLTESDGVRTRIELDVRAKVFGVGAMVERFMANETRKRYQVVEQVLQRLADADTGTGTDTNPSATGADEQARTSTPSA